MDAWQPLLDWWFGAEAPAAEVAAARHGLWFGKRDEQDREAEQRFGVQVRQALSGGLQDWKQSPQGWLALLILLDQLPRMIFRNTPQAFAGDPLALALLEDGLAKQWDRRLPPIRRVFAYLILEHAEDPLLQDRAVACFRVLLNEATEEERGLFANFLEFAERHQQVIRLFGRFPHRNAILGRHSSPKEVAFLGEPGSRF
ncbi:DUF924 family protein [Pseudomonas sp. NCCP-436]|uniref:DUF924 family protein n=1 Tax=Pseudomonas sp. NCCP-436 TaxID=2842481 RepID=UPI001C809A5B|nr:DUF924 family protein [Pseudomonas sp. NCCP-436]GIZ10981.1 hypothetical protein NCCP436_03970 [Pseudomonas sp. NCCP-436]